jgi:hydrogenase maturation protein HypF
MGRLFDAVASLLGVRHDVDHEGQAAMELEALATLPDELDRPTDGRGTWSFGIDEADGVLILDPRPVVRAAVASVHAGTSTAAAASAFHDAVADAVLRSALTVRATHGARTVGLSGGVFQNARLTLSCRGRLERHGFTVLVHRDVPPNDGGLALGQVAVAAAGGGERR